MLTLKPAQKRTELANGVKAYLVFFGTKNRKKYAEIVDIGISASGVPVRVHHVTAAYSKPGLPQQLEKDQVCEFLI